VRHPGRLSRPVPAPPAARSCPQGQQVLALRPGLPVRSGRFLRRPSQPGLAAQLVQPGRQVPPRRILVALLARSPLPSRLYPSCPCADVSHDCDCCSGGCDGACCCRPLHRLWPDRPPHCPPGRARRVSRRWTVRQATARGTAGERLRVDSRPSPRVIHGLRRAFWAAIPRDDRTTPQQGFSTLPPWTRTRTGPVARLKSDHRSRYAKRPNGPPPAARRLAPTPEECHRSNGVFVRSLHVRGSAAGSKGRRGT
jgi:hypothetical protein